jgi:hypothetical protein
MAVRSRGSVAATTGPSGEPGKHRQYDYRVKVLGVTCSPKNAHLALVADGAVVDAPVERIDVATLHEASEELKAMLDEVGRALAQTQPDLVVVLLPEQARFQRPYTELAARATLETLFRLAAVNAGIDVEVLARATVRSRLKLPRKGDLSSHVTEVFPKPVGRYWAAGRDVAALAARAGEVAA